MSMSIDAPGAAVSRRSAPPPPPSREQTLADLLRQAKRAEVPVRNEFVQQGRGKSTRPGPLASFVSNHDERGLDTYLLVHAMASHEPWDCTYPSNTWVRALGLGMFADPASARAAVSKIMRRLESRKLVERARVGRRSSVTLLREDGSGAAYTRPGKVRGDQYLRLPHVYWFDEHYKTLSLPGKALLLVALSLPDGFELAYERGPAWYGLSADTTERGLRALEDAGLIRYESRWEADHRSPTAWVERRRYTLLGAYAEAHGDPAARKGETRTAGRAGSRESSRASGTGQPTVRRGGARKASSAGGTATRPTRVAGEAVGTRASTGSRKGSTAKSAAAGAAAESPVRRTPTTTKATRRTRAREVKP